MRINNTVEIVDRRSTPHPIPTEEPVGKIMPTILYKQGNPDEIWNWDFPLLLTVSIPHYPGLQWIQIKTRFMLVLSEGTKYNTILRDNEDILIRQFVRHHLDAGDQLQDVICPRWQEEPTTHYYRIVLKEILPNHWIDDFNYLDGAKIQQIIGKPRERNW